MLNLLNLRVNFHLEISNPEECTALENDFAEEVRKRGEDFKYFKDQVKSQLTFLSSYLVILLSLESTPRRELPMKNCPRSWLGSPP